VQLAGVADGLEDGLLDGLEDGVTVVDVVGVGVITPEVTVTLVFWVSDETPGPRLGWATEVAVKAAAVVPLAALLGTVWVIQRMAYLVGSMKPVSRTPSPSLSVITESVVGSKLPSPLSR
jgi:hypothetical protein